MVVRWNEVIENDHGIPSTIQGSTTATECQTEPFPMVVVVHHITNDMTWLQNNNAQLPPINFIVKNDKSTPEQIEDIPFIDEEELEISKEKKDSNTLVQG